MNLDTSNLVRSLLLITALGSLGACSGGSDNTAATTGVTETSAGGEDNSSDDNTSTGDATTVDAGLDQVVAQGATVQLQAALDGSASALTWEQLSGPNVDLSDATSETPSFTAPTVADNTLLVFEARLGGDVSDTVSVEVWVPFDQTDAEVLGDFSGNDGWQCDVDLGIDSDYAEDAQGLEISLTSNGIPDHAVGTFPNNGNPNAISEQSDLFNIPLEPEKTDEITETKIFGITLDGIRFDRQTAECYNNEQACSWRYEAVTPGVASNAGNTNWIGASGWIGTDCNNAHVQPGGVYHYHGLPESLINKLGDSGNQMTMVGHAADGFPIYARWGLADPLDANSEIVRMEASYQVKAGTRPDGPGGAYSGIFVQDWEYVEEAGDLDACSGRFGVTPEYPEGIYHYYLTDDYPYIPKCVYGVVADDRFLGGAGG